MTRDFNPADNLDEDARRKGGQNSPGNFKNDPERASEAGRKGGEASHGGRSSSQNR
jgi:uncharacterized protein